MYKNISNLLFDGCNVEYYVEYYSNIVILEYQILFSHICLTSLHNKRITELKK